MSELLLPLRVLQGVLALLVLSLSSYVANWYNAETLTASPNEVNFLIFASSFTFVAILYLELTPRFANRASHPYLHLFIEVVTFIFYLAGFIALLVFIRKLEFCLGSVCAAARADVFFGALSFVTWVTSSLMLCWEMWVKRGNIKPLPISSTHSETPEMERV